MLSTFDYSWTTKAATQPVGIKRRDDKEKRYGSHMAGWGERARSVWKQAEPGSGACEAIRERRRLDSLTLSSIRSSSSQPSVCQDKQMRRHMLERLLENYWESFSSRTRWKAVCNPVVFMLLHTVTVFFLYIPFLGMDELEKYINYHKMCHRILLFFKCIHILYNAAFIMNNALHYQMKAWLYCTQTVLCSYTMICLAERKTN